MTAANMNIFLIVDDHEIFRSGLIGLLSSVYPDAQLLEASDAAGAYQHLESTEVDVVILDHEMPETNGAEIFDTIKERFAGTRVIFLTGLHSGVLVKNLVSKGAVAVLAKSGSGDELLKVIDAAISKDTYVSKAFDEDLTKAGVFDSLTKRERESLSLLIRGMSTQKVADEMGVTFKTAETHRTSLMSKLDVHSYPELIAWSTERGLIR